MRVPVDVIHAVVMRGLDPRIHHLCKIYAKKDGPAGQARGCRRQMDERRLKIDRELL
jgi:hypothetical protein